MREYSGQYVYGNTVRKQNPYSYERETEYRDYSQVGRKSEVIKNNKRYNLRMELPALILIVLASCAVLFICSGYLKVQSSITSRIKNIEIQEAKLEALRTENDALESNINSSMNLDYVYSVAVNQLGMVYAGRDQVIRYDRTESEYVRQNEDIP